MYSMQSKYDVIHQPLNSFTSIDLCVAWVGDRMRARHQPNKQRMHNSRTQREPKSKIDRERQQRKQKAAQFSMFRLCVVAILRHCNLHELSAAASRCSSQWVRLFDGMCALFWAKLTSSPPAPSRFFYFPVRSLILCVFYLRSCLFSLIFGRRYFCFAEIVMVVVVGVVLV